jgi:hypothetical protein
MKSTLVIVGTQMLQPAATWTAGVLSRAGRGVKHIQAGEPAITDADESSQVNLWVLSEPAAPPAPSGEFTWAPRAVAVLDDCGVQDLALFGADGAMVLRRDLPSVAALEPAPALAGRGPRAVPKAAPREVITLGPDAPVKPGDWGCVNESGMSWLVRAVASDESGRKRKDGGSAQEVDVHLQRLMPTQALPGWSDEVAEQQRQVIGALAALALGTLVGCSLAVMLHALRDPRGLDGGGDLA